MEGVAVFIHCLWLFSHQNLLDIVPKLKKSEKSYVYKGEWKEINDVEMKKKNWTDHSNWCL